MSRPASQHPAPRMRRGGPDITEHLRRAIGADAVLAAGDERLVDYGRDESAMPAYPPDCVALCSELAQVVEVLRLAREHRVPVTPRGAGSGKTGGCLPVRGGIVLSTERMMDIREIDEGDLIAVARPGVITGALQEAVEARGLFYPPDPASLAVCSLGGNVACNAGGPRAFKYGVTREYVVGLEVALMGGEVLRVGRRTAKGVTGYDLVGGFVGTEGTFGVITEITVKLLPLPRAVATMVALFPRMADAGGAVRAILAAGFLPRTLEIADATAIEHVRALAAEQPDMLAFPRDTGAMALIELDGEPEGLEAALVRAGQLCEAAGAVDVLVATDARAARGMWNARRSISRALKRAYPAKVSEDVCVPRGALPEMLARIDRIAARFELPLASYGHAGDGNLHVNILRSDQPAETVDAAVRALFEDTIALGGTLSGEHGIGLAKRDYLPLEHAPRLIEWQRRWKRMWDPDDLLNPGKILPARPGGCHE